MVMKVNVGDWLFEESWNHARHWNNLNEGIVRTICDFQEVNFIMIIGVKS